MKAPLTNRFVRHGLFWLGVLAFSLLVQLPAYVGAGTRLYVWGLFFNQLPASMLTTYPLLYWVLPRLLRQRQTGLFLLLLAGWLLACLGLTGLTRMFFDQVVMPGLLHQEPDPSWQPTGYWKLNYTFFMALVTAGAAVATKVVDGWYEQRQLSLRLEQRRLHTDLQLLKAQLQPSFLFGTLNTLRALTARAAPESPAAVLHLAGLLRYMLYESPRNTVGLADEVEMIRHYVALEELRTDRRADVSFSCTGPLDAHALAPLLLLPVVENAFRLGTVPELECPWVSIDLVVRRDALVLKVISSQLPPAAGCTESPELCRLRKRLSHLYADRYQLSFVSEPDTLLAVLHVPLTAGAAVAAGPPRAASFATLNP
ncbi:hypothetical protein GCM10027048_38770 [Hymenobacter coalescens]